MARSGETKGCGWKSHEQSRMVTQEGKYELAPKPWIAEAYTFLFSPPWRSQRGKQAESRGGGWLFPYVHIDTWYFSQWVDQHSLSLTQMHSPTVKPLHTTAQNKVQQGGATFCWTKISLFFLFICSLFKVGLFFFNAVISCCNLASVVSLILISTLKEKCSQKDYLNKHIWSHILSCVHWEALMSSEAWFHGSRGSEYFLLSWVIDAAHPQLPTFLAKLHMLSKSSSIKSDITSS